MVEIPNTYARRPVPSMAQPVARLSGGEAVGQAIQNLGRGVRDVEAGIDMFQEKRAAAEALEADTALAAQLDDALYDPESGYLTLKQRGAVDGHDAFISRIEGMKSEALAGLSGRARQRAESVIARRIQAAKATAMRHAATENDRWVTAATDSAIAINKNHALLNWNDPRAISNMISANRALIDGKAERMGWSAEQIALEKQMVASDTVAGVVMQRAVDDPVGALEFARQNKNLLGGERFAKIEATLTPISRQYEGRAIARDVYGASSGKSANVEWSLGRRNLPLAEEFTTSLSNIVATVDPSVSIVITSAGQKPGTDSYVRGHRHNVDESGEGHTADIVLKKDGRRVTPEQAPELYAQVIEEAARHHPGIGHYTWGIHIGGGKAAFWGPDMTSASADPAFKAAYDRGRAHAVAPGAAPGAAPAVETPGVVPAPSGSLADVMERTKNAHPDVQAAAVAEWKNLEAIRAAEAKAARNALQAKAYALVIEGGDPDKDLTPDEQVALGIDYMNKLRAYKDTDRETDPATIYALTLMAGEPNKAFKDPDGNEVTFRNVNLLDYLDRLDQADFEALAKAQAKAIGGQKTAYAKYSSVRRMVDMVVRDNPIDWNADPGTAEHARAQAVMLAMKAEFDDYVEREEKQPPEDVQMQMARRVLADTSLGGEPGFWSSRGMANALSPFANFEGDAMTYADVFGAIDRALNEGEDITLGAREYSAAEVSRLFEGVQKRMPNATREQVIMGIVRALAAREKGSID